MMKTYYAIELRLWAITADVDEQGTRILGTEPTKEEVFCHYNGTLTDQDAHAQYAACDAILSAPRE
jgi:hypothetical protein